MKLLFVLKKNYPYSHGTVDIHYIYSDNNGLYRTIYYQNQNAILRSRHFGYMNNDDLGVLINVSVVKFRARKLPARINKLLRREAYENRRKPSIPHGHEGADQ